MFIVFCEFGHEINNCADTPTARPSERFCKKCGKPAVETCPTCQEPFPNPYDAFSPGAAFGDAFLDRRRPAYCGACGNALPWTQLAMRCLDEAAQLSELNKDAAGELLQIAPDLFRQTPSTATATLKLNRILAQLVGDARAAIVAIMMNFAVEYVRKRVQ